MSNRNSKQIAKRRELANNMADKTVTVRDIKVFDNKEILISGVVAGAILWYSVDELETLWGEFTGWIDDKLNGFNEALSNVF